MAGKWSAEAENSLRHGLVKYHEHIEVRVRDLCKYLQFLIHGREIPISGTRMHKDTDFGHRPGRCWMISEWPWMSCWHLPSRSISWQMFFLPCVSYSFGSLVELVVWQLKQITAWNGEHVTWHDRSCLAEFSLSAAPLLPTAVGISRILWNRRTRT